MNQDTLAKRYLNVLQATLLVVLLSHYSAFGAEAILSKIRRVPFLENQGQIGNPDIRYYAATPGGSTYISSSADIYYALRAPGEPGDGWCLLEHCDTPRKASVSASQPAATRINYLNGHDTASWHIGIPSWQRVDFGEVFPGICLSLEAKGKNVEKLFFVSPHAEPCAIRMRFEGTEGLAVRGGELEVATPFGPVRFSRPIAYQESSDGTRQLIDVRYVVHDETSYGFAVGFYDPERQLVIDPLLASTFIGSGSWGDDDYVFGIAVGPSNKVYVAGSVETGGFPTVPGCYQTVYGGGFDEAFVCRFDKDLTTLEASTYLGGAGRDVAKAIAVDAAGNVYVAGYTSSTDFPTTPGAFSNTLNAASTDAFVCRLDSGLTNLLASTLIGGSHTDDAAAIALGPGKVYIAGNTRYRNDFPTTPGAYAVTNAGDADAFVSCFDVNLTSLLASTMIGGHYDETCTSLAVDAVGNMYIAGHSGSAPILYPPTFPVTTGAYANEWLHTLEQGFICKFNPGAGLLVSAIFGGYYEEEVNGLALDGDGNIYVAGGTGSADFPTTPSAYATNNQSAKEAFVCKFDNSLSNLLASTYLGGGNDDWAYALDVSPIGVAVTGYTWANDFPATPGAFQSQRDGSYRDVFVSRLDRNLQNLFASTYIGSTKTEFGYALVYGNETIPSIHVAGCSDYRFPTTSGAYDPSYGSSSEYEGFVCKFDALFARIDDIDGDGMPDWWEIIHSGTDTGVLANVDYDLDGITSLAEYICGTDPLIRSSVFRLVPPVATDALHHAISFPSVDGRLYGMESIDNLTSNPWVTVEEDIVGSGDSIVIMEASTPPNKFYKGNVSFPEY